ncbi:hypothetical protein [Actinomadura luteofluorescens]|uniref:hypothetical protein n=1 Tax=Actinomadura luteofluorescens TaxID=46163 RepID=UPI003D94AD73
MDTTMTPEQLREDRIMSSYLHARRSIEEAAAAMKELLPQKAGTVEKLKKARADLDWYLSELEKASG